MVLPHGKTYAPLFTKGTSKEQTERTQQTDPKTHTNPTEHCRPSTRHTSICLNTGRTLASEIHLAILDHYLPYIAETLQSLRFSDSGTMARSRQASRQDMLEASTSTSSSSSSPERAAYEDDTDFFTAQRNDSQSSIGALSLRDITMSPSSEREREYRVSPISRLPPELLIAMFSRLSLSVDLRSCMLVSKTWARNSAEMLWHRPLCNTWQNLANVTQSIQIAEGYFPYNALVKRLNLSNLNEQINDGSVQPFMQCKRIERLTLTGCTRLTDSGVCNLICGSKSILALDITGLDAITDHTLKAVSQNCVRLQGLNITDCSKVTDESLVAVAQNCHSLKRVKIPLQRLLHLR